MVGHVARPHRPDVHPPRVCAGGAARSKLTPAARSAFEEVVIWAQLGADPPYDLLGGVPALETTPHEQADLQAVHATELGL